MIAILINGTLGSGKTETARALNRLLDNSVHIEGDGLLWKNPSPLSSDERLGHIQGQLPAILAYWKGRKTGHVVFSYLMPESFFITGVEDIFKKAGCSVFTFTLFPGQSLVHERIIGRDRLGKPEYELAPSDEKQKILETQPYLGKTIKVLPAMSPRDVAAQILSHIAGRDGIQEIRSEEPRNLYPKGP